MEEQTYSIWTDGFSVDVEADSLDEAIAEAFDGEGLGKITDVISLERKFAKYVDDGGWCRITCDGELVFEMGECP